MQNNLTDADLLTFILAGCNAPEVAAYAGIPVEAADLRLQLVNHECRQMVGEFYD